MILQMKKHIVSLKYVRNILYIIFKWNWWENICSAQWICHFPYSQNRSIEQNNRIFKVKWTDWHTYSCSVNDHHLLNHPPPPPSPPPPTHTRRLLEYISLNHHFHWQQSTYKSRSSQIQNEEEDFSYHSRWQITSYRSRSHHYTHTHTYRYLSQKHTSEHTAHKRHDIYTSK